MSDNVFSIEEAKKKMREEQVDMLRIKYEDKEYDSMSLWADSEQIDELVESLRGVSEKDYLYELTQAAADCITDMRHAIIRMDWMYVQDQRHIDTLRAMLASHHDLLASILRSRQETLQ